MRTVFLSWLAFCCVIWLLALVSFKAGNPTAINALVGIPIGIAISSLVWLTFEELDRRS